METAESMMPKEVYRRLAQRLDAIPNGFPPTESGAELLLLAHIFEPEEAALAAWMRMTPEPAPDIALRAGVSPDAARDLLQRMARRGLIHAERDESQHRYGLIPFVVGIYENLLPRMDAELATLFEQYYQESRGAVLAYGPTSMHRVIPVEAAIPHDLEILPYERASELLDQARSWGVQDCICRVQKRLAGQGCGRPEENCLTFSPVEGAFDHSPTHRALTRAEAQQILIEAEDAGLVHSTYNYRSGNFYICNCCPCCCGILRGVAEFAHPTAIARSAFRATVKVDACVGCGGCIDRCSFGALSLAEVEEEDGPGAHCVVDDARCVGCGLCVAGCPSAALALQRLPEAEVPLTPLDMQAWMERRARERGISLSDIV